LGVKSGIFKVKSGVDVQERQQEQQLWLQNSKWEIAQPETQARGPKLFDIDS